MMGLYGYRGNKTGHYLRTAKADGWVRGSPHHSLYLCLFSIENRQNHERVRELVPNRKVIVPSQPTELNVHLYLLKGYLE